MRGTLVKSANVISMDEPTARRQFRETYGSLVAQRDGGVDFIAPSSTWSGCLGFGEPKL